MMVGDSEGMRRQYPELEGIGGRRSDVAGTGKEVRSRRISLEAGMMARRKRPRAQCLQNSYSVTRCERSKVAHTTPAYDS